MNAVSPVSQTSSFAPVVRWLKAVDLRIVGLAVGALCVLAIAIMAIRSLYLQWKISGQTTDSGVSTSGILPISTTNTSADAAASSAAMSSGTAAAMSSSVASSTTATILTTAAPQSQTTPQPAIVLDTMIAVTPKSKFEEAVDKVIQECQRQKDESYQNSDASTIVCTFQWGEFPYEIETMRFSELQNNLPGWLKEKAGNNKWFDLGVEVTTGMASGQYKILILELQQ